MSEAPVALSRSVACRIRLVPHSARVSRRLSFFRYIRHNAIKMVPKAVDRLKKKLRICLLKIREEAAVVGEICKNITSRIQR